MKKNKFIIHVTIGFDGGVGTVIKNLILNQLSEGYKVGVIYPKCTKSDNFLDNIDINISRFDFKCNNIKGINIIKGLPIKKIYSSVKKDYPDMNIIIHAHNTVSIGLFKKINNLPLICSIHGINSTHSSFSKKITKLTLKKLHKNNVEVFGVSKNTVDYYNKELGKKFMKVIRNGIEIKKSNKFIEFNKFTVAFVSYIDELKGWKYLFEAYDKLDNKNNINIIFVGDGPSNEILELKKCIKEKKVEENIQYLGSIENAGEKIIPYINILVLPSKNEGIPMVILESISNGIPVLASKVGGIPEIIKDGYNGLFVRRNSDDIANKINILMKDKQYYERISKNAKQSYFESFTLSRMCSEYREAYDKVSKNV